MQGAIDVVGSRNAFQVVTDNVTNCKAAEREIEKVNKHIFCSPCSVHTLNLIFKDLAQKFYWLMDIYKKGKRIVKYFLNHSQVLDMFRENSIFELLKVGKTRFASHFVFLRRLVDCRETQLLQSYLTRGGIGLNKVTRTPGESDLVLLKP